MLILLTTRQDKVKDSNLTLVIFFKDQILAHGGLQGVTG